MLITYSDEGLGHTGYVYRCAGWTPTARNLRPQYQLEERRTSPYTNGNFSVQGLRRVGVAYCQRWEHWACERGQALAWLESHGWRRVKRADGRTWRSGQPGYTWQRETAD